VSSLTSVPGFTSGNGRLPILAEVSMTVARVLTILVTGIVTVLSIFAKASVLAIILRAGVSLLVLGTLTFLINWLVSRYLIQATLEEWKEAFSVDPMGYDERD